MKVLILGSGGMLGNSVLNFFSKSKKYKIYAHKREYEKIDENYMDVSFFYGDVFGAINFNKIIYPDIIINCVGMINVDACERFRNEAFDINANLVKLCHNHFPESKFIYISTDSVYNGDTGNYYETDEISPLNYYAETKLSGENFTMLFSKFMILRLNIYGFNNKQNSLCDWVLISLKNSKSIYGFDNVYFNPLNVCQVPPIIENLLIKNFNGIINLGSNSRISKYNFINKFSDAFDFKKTLILKKQFDPNDFIAKRPLDTSLNLSKLFNLNIEIPDLNTGIKLLKIQKNE